MPDSKPDFSRRYEAIRDLLACPACHGELTLAGDRLTCAQCLRGYAVVDGIPVLIPARTESNELT